MVKIIIAIDYNSSAQLITETGYKLAKALDAEAVLLHVISDLAYYTMLAPDVMGYGLVVNPIDNMASIRKEAERFMLSCANHVGDDSLRTIVLEGEIEETIIQCCDIEKADMLVMGSHRHKGIERILLTDVAAYVLHHTKIPLLTIPNSKHLSKNAKEN